MSDHENNVNMGTEENNNNETINWYLEDKPDRLKRIQQQGLLWVDLTKKCIDLKNQCDQAESKYFQVKNSFYNATNVAVVDGDITTAESIGYIEEMKEIDRRIIEMKKRVSANRSRPSNSNRHGRHVNRNGNGAYNSKHFGHNSNRNLNRNGTSSSKGRNSSGNAGKSQNAGQNRSENLRRQRK